MKKRVAYQPKVVILPYEICPGCSTWRLADKGRPWTSYSKCGKCRGRKT